MFHGDEPTKTEKKEISFRLSVTRSPCSWGETEVVFHHTNRPQMPGFSFIFPGTLPFISVVG